MQDVNTINGDSGGEILLPYADDGEAPTDAPMLVGAERGFACFQIDMEHQHVPEAEALPLLGLAQEMRVADDGMWLATVETSGRNYALVQSNRGYDGPSFYEIHNATSDGPAWRDFYYRATYFLLDRIDQQWSPEEVVVRHPTGFGWPEGLMPVVLEAAGNLLDSRPVAIKRLVFGGERPCGLKSADEITKGIEDLSGDDQNGHREIDFEERSPEDLGYNGPAPVRLFKINVLDH